MKNGAETDTVPCVTEIFSTHALAGVPFLMRGTHRCGPGGRGWRAAASAAGWSAAVGLLFETEGAVGKGLMSRSRVSQNKQRSNTV